MADPWHGAPAVFGNGSPNGPGRNDRNDGDDAGGSTVFNHIGNSGAGSGWGNKRLLWGIAVIGLSALLCFAGCGDDDEEAGPPIVDVFPPAQADVDPDGVAPEDAAAPDADTAPSTDTPSTDDDTAVDAEETEDAAEEIPTPADATPEVDAPEAPETADTDDAPDVPDTIGPPVVPTGTPFGTPVDNPIFADATDANTAGCLYADQTVITPFGFALAFDPELFDTPEITPIGFQFAAYPVTNSATPVLPWFAGPTLVFNYEPGTKEDFNEATWHAEVNGQALVAFAHHDWPLGEQTYPLVIEIADPLTKIAYYWPADFPTAIMECPEVPL